MIWSFRSGLGSDQAQDPDLYQELRAQLDDMEVGEGAVAAKASIGEAGIWNC